MLQAPENFGASQRPSRSGPSPALLRVFEIPEVPVDAYKRGKDPSASANVRADVRSLRLAQRVISRFVQALGFHHHILPLFGN